MKKLAMHSAAVAFMVLASVPSFAMPMQPQPTSEHADFILVAGGCGPAFHRGPLGGCRPNRAVIVARPVCRTVLLPLPHRVCR